MASSPSKRELLSTRFRVTGMDCPSCTKEIEAEVKKIDCVREVKVSLASQIMTVQSDTSDACLETVEGAVKKLGYQLSRLQAENAIREPNGVEELPSKLSHVTRAYRRALWTVFLLNAGYGVIELVAGFFANSQALKADALDFIGDGLITFLGLLAITWSLRWRARVALLQGLFLGALGLAVMITTAYRIFFTILPKAELMGAFGAIALLVNIASAAVLVPHRAGDANARAIWLFSRNDAIGNIAVVIAALLVAWSGTPWPDYLVALIIAGLFLHSAWLIVKDARGELNAFANRPRSE